MFEGVHDEDGQSQAEDVGQEASVEIRPAVLLQTGERERQVNNTQMREREHEIEKPQRQRV